MDEDIKRIEDFLLGVMPDEDSIAFQSRLDSDKAFREKFELEKQLFDTFNEKSWSFTPGNNPEVHGYQSALKSSEFSKIKETIKEASKRYGSESPKANNNKRLVVYLAAASIALLIAVQFIFNQTPSGKELYHAYIDMEGLPGFVTRADDLGNDAVNAQQLFENHNYEASIELFEGILGSQPKDSRVYIYLGVAYVEAENYKRAEQVFDNLTSSNLLDAEKGYWYKSLLYLKMNEKEKALQILTKIKDEKRFNYNKAEELIEELD